MNPLCLFRDGPIAMAYGFSLEDKRCWNLERYWRLATVVSESLCAALES